MSVYIQTHRYLLQNMHRGHRKNCGRYFSTSTMYPIDQTQVNRLGIKHFYLLNYVAGLHLFCQTSVMSFHVLIGTYFLITDKIIKLIKLKTMILLLSIFHYNFYSFHICTVPNTCKMSRIINVGGNIAYTWKERVKCYSMLLNLLGDIWSHCEPHVCFCVY